METEKKYIVYNSFHELKYFKIRYNFFLGKNSQTIKMWWIPDYSYKHDCLYLSGTDLLCVDESNNNPLHVYFTSSHLIQTIYSNAKKLFNKPINDL